MSTELLPNQHHVDVTKESVREAILTFCDRWNKAACDDCSPTILDDALEGFDLVEFGPVFRRIGIDLANTGEWMCQQAEEDQ